MLIVARTLHFAQFSAVCPRVFRKVIHDVGVVPAAARLKLLGGEHIVCIRHKDIRGFKGTHKAGVKADELKLVRHLVVDGVQRFVYFPQGQAVALVQLVKAHAADTAAAMIPEHKSHIFRWVVLNTPRYKIRQGVCASHACVGDLVHKL